MTQLSPIDGNGRIPASIVETWMRDFIDLKRSCTFDKSTGTWAWFRRGEYDTFAVVHSGYPSFLDMLEKAARPWVEHFGPQLNKETQLGQKHDPWQQLVMLCTPDSENNTYATIRIIDPYTCELEFHDSSIATVSLVDGVWRFDSPPPYDDATKTGMYDR